MRHELARRPRNLSAVGLGPFSLGFRVIGLYEGLGLWGLEFRVQGYIGVQCHGFLRGAVGLVTALCRAASQETTPWTQKPEARISRMLYWALLGFIAF